MLSLRRCRVKRRGCDVDEWCGCLDEKSRKIPVKLWTREVTCHGQAPISRVCTWQRC